MPTVIRHSVRGGTCIAVSLSLAACHRGKGHTNSLHGEFVHVTAHHPDPPCYNYLCQSHCSSQPSSCKQSAPNPIRTTCYDAHYGQSVSNLQSSVRFTLAALQHNSPVVRPSARGCKHYCGYVPSLPLATPVALARFRVLWTQKVVITAPAVGFYSQ